MTPDQKKEVEKELFVPVSGIKGFFKHIFIDAFLAAKTFEEKSIRYSFYFSYFYSWVAILVFIISLSFSSLIIILSTFVLINMLILSTYRVKYLSNIIKEQGKLIDEIIDLNTPNTFRSPPSQN